MDQETAGERISGLPRDLLAIAILVAIVLPVEDDGVHVGTDQAVVRYSDPVLDIGKVIRQAVQQIPRGFGEIVFQIAKVTADVGMKAMARAVHRLHHLLTPCCGKLMLRRSVPLGFILVPEITVLSALTRPMPNSDFATFCTYRSTEDGTPPDKSRSRSGSFAPKCAYSKASYPCGHYRIIEPKLGGGCRGTFAWSANITSRINGNPDWGKAFLPVCADAGRWTGCCHRQGVWFHPPGRHWSR